LKRFKKEKNIGDLVEADSISVQLKKTVKRVARRRIQTKATHPNPKVFWKTVNELCGRTQTQNDELSLCTEKGLITDSGEISETFATFFVEKAENLSKKTCLRAEHAVEEIGGNAALLISEDMVGKAIKTLKRKKSHGIDGTPLCVIKDTYGYLKRAYLRLMQMSTVKIPDVWKVARVIPLFKKGDKSKCDNYRPISNLCSMEKLFEKIILHELNRRHPNLEGIHQHGFRASHSTSTAMLEIQHDICSELDRGKPCLVYSVDLSAAFDLLRRETFYDTLKTTLDGDLMSIIMDFLSKRKFIVEYDGKMSDVKSLSLGCVQGSVLGPKLFNLYMKDLTSSTLGFKTTTYANDTYVLITGDSHNEIKSNAERCLLSHLEYLKGRGMVTNVSKTEIVMFGHEDRMTLTIGDDNIESGNSMKVLGVQFDSRMKWSNQIDQALIKGRRLCSGLKFIRQKLTRYQFLKVMTCQFYSSVYYGCETWLNNTTSFNDLRKLNSLHYRALRIATRDFKRTNRRSELDTLGRARPSVWTKYLTASRVIKTANLGLPVRLSAYLNENSYVERRRPGRIKYFDNSRSKIGRQTLNNRAGQCVNDVDFDWKCDNLTNDRLRLCLKKCFKMTNCD